jgi:mRNA interferase HigB
VTVRIISVPALSRFVERNPSCADAWDPTMAWYRQVKSADWATPADVKRDLRTASILKDGRVVFNIAGNHYESSCGSTIRVASSIIRFIGTHRQYDRIDPQTI